MFPALLGASEHFIATSASLVEFLGHCFPVEVRKTDCWPAFNLMILNHISEKLALAGIPAAGRKVDLPEAQPFEHAASGCDSRYQSRNPFPVLMPKFMLEVLNALFVTVLGYDPHQNLYILLTPIFLDFLVLQHLLDARGCEAQDGLVTDVSPDYFTTAVELLAVG